MTSPSSPSHPSSPSGPSNPAQQPGDPMPDRAERTSSAASDRDGSAPSPKKAKNSLPLTVFALVILALLTLPFVAVGLLTQGLEPDYLPRLFGKLLPRYVGDTFWLLVGTAIGAGALGLIVSLLTGLYEFPGRRLAVFASFMPLAIPGYLVAYYYGEALSFGGPFQSALRDLFGWSGRQDYWFPDIKSLGGAVFIFSFVLFPYVFVAIRAALSARLYLILEVGRVAGRSWLFALVRVGVPLVAPALFGGMILAALEAVGDFGVVEYFGVRTFTFAIFDLWLNKSKMWAAGVVSLLSLFIVVVLVAVEQRMRRALDTHGVGASAHNIRRPLPRLLMPLVWLLALGPAVVGFLIPTAGLLVAMVQAMGAGTLIVPLDAVADTLVIAAVMAVLIPIFVTFLTWQWRWSPANFAGQALGAAVEALGRGYALPGLVLALGIGWMLRTADLQLLVPLQTLLGLEPSAWLSGSLLMVAYAYVVRFSAPASPPIRSGLALITPNVVATAKLLGRGPWHRLRLVYLPMLSHPLFLAVLLVSVEVAKELPIMLFLRPVGFETLALVSYSYGSESLISQASFPALLIILMGVVPAAVIAASSQR